MWTYEITTGKMFDPTARLEGMGYSGAGADKNVPADENVPDQGPIPEGMYTIGEPFDSPDHGPYVMRLTPDATNREYGRGGFLLHGDSIKNPGTASKGCIIQSHSTRVAVGTSTDKRLQVVAIFSGLGLSNS